MQPIAAMILACLLAPSAMAVEVTFLSDRTAADGYKEELRLRVAKDGKTHQLSHYIHAGVGMAGPYPAEDRVLADNLDCKFGAVDARVLACARFDADQDLVYSFETERRITTTLDAYDKERTQSGVRVNLQTSKPEIEKRWKEREIPTSFELEDCRADR